MWQVLLRAGVCVRVEVGVMGMYIPTRHSAEYGWLPTADAKTARGRRLRPGEKPQRCCGVVFSDTPKLTTA